MDKSIVSTSLMALFWFLCPLAVSKVGAMDASDASEVIELATLSHLYAPVRFDHLAHSELVDCSRCHHHSTGTGQEDSRCQRCHGQEEEADTVACGDCHAPAPWQDTARSSPIGNPRYHIDIPGLTGAYHLSCLNCHLEFDAPSDCQDCHALTEEGASFLAIDRPTAAVPGQTEPPQATRRRKSQPERPQ
jgi:hypothetical protein